jgi:hypothetical protein
MSAMLPEARPAHNECAGNEVPQACGFAADRVSQLATSLADIPPQTRASDRV